MNNDLDIQFRSFKRADQDVVKNLILQGLGEHFGYVDPLLNPDLDDIKVNYTDAGNYFVVVELEKTIIGTGALLKETVDSGRIVRVSVASSQRGLGIGQMIVSHLVRVGKRSKCKKILVETNHGWYAAIALYERCGFHEYARDQESIHMVIEP